MKQIYTLLFYLMLPAMLLRLVWRGFRSPDYWKRWSERFGYIPAAQQKPLIWVHAVSVGEVEACRPLIKALQRRFPDHRIHMTTMTPTGSARVKSVFADTVTHSYLPYDLPASIKRFMRRLQPDFGIIMETEIWPNLIAACHQQAMPLFLVNARMSARSARGYARFRPFVQATLQKLTLIAVQSEDDKQRFQALGADKQQLHITGNLKYECVPPEGIPEQAAAMRELWGQQRPVIIAASTHEGEEALLINASRPIRARFPDLLLIIVPRHPERFDHVAALAQKSGLKTLRRSEYRPCASDVNLLIVDTMGELPLFYAASDIAFVGGSLVPHGGHNILEPAALGKAIITGPHCFNFHQITRTFAAAQALIQVNNLDELVHCCLDLLSDTRKRQQMGQNSVRLLVHHQGASERLVNLIQFRLQHHEHG